MKPLNLLALVVFFIGTAWVLTRSAKAVREIQATYYTCIEPFISKGSVLDAKVKSFNDEVEHSHVLASKLNETQQELDILRSKVQHLEKIAEEVDGLRDALHFSQREKFSAVTANILRRNPSTWWQTAVVDRGTKDLVQDYQPVLSPEGLVGKVDIANRLESTILLLTDEKCQVSAKVAGTNEVGIVNGQRIQSDGRPTLRLRFLSPNTILTPGMKVFTTGRGGIFPPDILLGTIERYKSGSFDAEAIVRPSVDFEKIQTVFILTSPQT
jgi:rod shape-determining protein MreC